MEMFREITDMVNDAKRMDKRQFIFQVLSFGMVIASAFMIWKGNKWSLVENKYKLWLKFPEFKIKKVYVLFLCTYYF